MNALLDSSLPAAATAQNAAAELLNGSDYQAWRRRKLSALPTPYEPVSIADPAALSESERLGLRARLQRDNMVWYRVTGDRPVDAATVCRLGAELGLHRLDANLHAEPSGVSEISVRAESAAGEFIPYTDRAINWHTDGYYNRARQRVRAFILHCVRPAALGGENRLLDFERIYIELRDHYPDYLKALMRENAFSIPPLVIDGREQRGWIRGPVFALLDGHLHMRYSARLRNVLWAEDAVTRAAAATLRDLIDSHPAVVRLTLAAGEGLISNNVLHARSAFKDEGAGRLLLRARYYDRVQDSGAAHVMAE